MGVFTRDEAELLSYDIDAFWYFASTMLMACVLPWTWLLLRSILSPRIGAEEDFNAAGPGAAELAKVRHSGTAAMEAKRRSSAAKALSWRYRLSGSIKYQLFVVCVLWLMLFVVLWTLKDAPAALRTFDPHEILGIGPDAEMKEIKKAYRVKSLAHHPDKDKDNPLAPVLFQKVAKAYAALTDDRARQNYAKYGNPDGPEQMKVGIALHPIVLGSKEIQKMTLCIFFSVLFLIPCCVLCCCLRGSRLSFEGVSADTLRVLGACIDEEVKAEDGPGLLAASAEAIRAVCSDITPLVQEIYRNHTPLEPGLNVEIFSGAIKINGAKLADNVTIEAKGVVRQCFPDKGTCEVEVREVKPGEAGAPPASAHTAGELREIQNDRLMPVEPRGPCPFSDQVVRRNCLLIWGHLWRLHRHMPAPIMGELCTVLRHSVTIGRAMIHFTAPHTRPDFFHVARNLVIFRRCLVQALDINASPFLQLPHMDAKLLTPKLLEDAPSFREVVAGDRESFLSKLKVSPEQRLDIDAFCRHAPLIDLSCKYEVLDEEGLAMGDMASLTVTLTRTNLEEGEAAGPVNAPFFPVPKWEEWWIIVFDERDKILVTVDRINGTNRVETTKINFMVPRAGDFRWTVHAFCDSYAGLDVSCPANFTALKKSQVNHDVFVHPEDMKIKTFFEELMEGLNVEREEEESESEDELPLRASVAEKLPRQAQAASASGSVEAAPAAEEEQRPKVNHGQDCDDSDCEGCEESQEPEGCFFEVTNISGATLYREPRMEHELRVGSVPIGVVIRAFDSSDSTSPPGWAVLIGSGGAWFPIDDPEAIELAEQTDTEGEPRVCVKRLGGLLELPLRTVVQTRLPLMLLKKWVKKSLIEITIEDVSQIVDIEETRIRTLIESFIRGKIGDARYEELRDETDKLKEKRKDRISKARGFFASQNGILWHVGPQGHVKGFQPDGSKIRDRILVSEDDKNIRIGPFTLEESRTCSCIHWLRNDDPEKAWVWARDNSLDTRVRLGGW